MGLRDLIGRGKEAYKERRRLQEAVDRANELVNVYVHILAPTIGREEFLKRLTQRVLFDCNNNGIVLEEKSVKLMADEYAEALGGKRYFLDRAMQEDLAKLWVSDEEILNAIERDLERLEFLVGNEKNFPSEARFVSGYEVAAIAEILHRAIKYMQSIIEAKLKNVKSAQTDKIIFTEKSKQRRVKEHEENIKFLEKCEKFLVK